MLFGAMGGIRLIAVMQQREANEPKRPFKVGMVSARNSAKAAVTALPIPGQQCSIS